MQSLITLPDLVLPQPRALPHPCPPAQQYLGPRRRQWSLPQEVHIPDRLILQLGPEQGVQLSQDGDEPAARDSTVRVSPDTRNSAMHTSHHAFGHMTDPAAGSGFWREASHGAIHTAAGTGAQSGACGFGFRFGSI